MSDGDSVDFSPLLILVTQLNRQLVEIFCHAESLLSI